MGFVERVVLVDVEGAHVLALGLARRERTQRRAAEASDLDVLREAMKAEELRLGLEHHTNHAHKCLGGTQCDHGNACCLHGQRNNADDVLEEPLETRGLAPSCWRQLGSIQQEPTTAARTSGLTPSPHCAITHGRAAWARACSISI